MKYIIINERNNAMVHEIRLGHWVGIRIDEVNFTDKEMQAIKFDTEDEANSAITFIGDVIDYELEQDLIIGTIQE